jgi:hypothetical protein
MFPKTASVIHYALFLLLGLSLLLATPGCSGTHSLVENWPAYTPRWQALAATQRAAFIADGLSYQNGQLEDYVPTGDYFNFETTDYSSYHFDAQGFPLNYDKLAKVYYYNRLQWPSSALLIMRLTCIRQRTRLSS